ncbi:MAG: 3-deoxy-7-phosphoheptulonate synthase [Patescibacteria group bacterium]
MNNKKILIAGPCAVENKKQILAIAKQLKSLGFEYLRGGAYKPRTNPNSFQGLGEDGLKYLLDAKKKYNLKIVTEIVSIEHINKVSNVADILQIGARNMFNYELLKSIAVKAPKKTILLKRHFSATKKELIGSVGYLEKYGHKGEVIVCERGIRTFANGEYDRFTLDISLIADLKKDKRFNHKIIVDPSHAAGRSDLVRELTLAGMSAGADGFIIEVKRDKNTIPLVDAKQAITIKELKNIIKCLYLQNSPLTRYTPTLR